MTEVPLYPLPFEPYLRPMPWGGTRLAHWIDGIDLGDLGGQVIGEAWLLSDHAVNASSVSAGPLAGVTIRELMATRSVELLGRRTVRFPLLIKLLDAREKLSIQVHPDDADAVQWAPLEGGKTEAWLVLERDPSAFILMGLKPDIDRATVAHELQAGALPLCLRRYNPQPGECYFVPAGTIHAQGDGIVVLEVQQTSDATFRLYDWGRVDAQGRPRQMHHEAALACLKERNEGSGPVKPDGERLVDCPYFRMSRRRVTTPQPLPSPSILVGLGGEALVTHAQGNAALLKGRAVLVPACLGTARLEPRAECDFVIVEIP